MCTPQCICEKLGDLGLEEAIKAWKYVRHYTENLQKLQVKLRDLGDCTATITREVSEAIGRDDEIEGSVMHWQTDADSLKVNIEKLIGESTTKASISCIACSCPNIVWRYKFSKRAEDKIANAVEIIKNCNNFNHQISHPRSHYMENLQKLKDELRDLGDCREIIRGKVGEVNGRGDEIEVNVLHWQTDVDSLLVYIEQLIRESTNICSTACPCPDITWQYNFSKQAEEKIADADGLIIKYNNFNQISHPRSHYAENLQKLKDKLRDLGDCREIIRGKVSEANGRGYEIEVNVSHWQTDADSLLDVIEQLIKESTNICSIECPCPDITWQYKFSKQAEEKIANADGLIIKYNSFNQISHPRPRPPELESLSDKNYVNFDSRASIFEDIMDALKDSNVNMIGVFGLGGVGKTTLVKEVGEQMRKDGTFKQVAMAVVSKDLNVKEVQSRLAASLNFKFEAEADDQVGRVTELWNKLTNGDKYLIILDDIWEKVDLKKAIGIPITDGKTGCKVVLTSRNEDLLSSRMEVNRNFSIGELLSAEAWTLFTKKVGNSFESQPELYSLAYKVCTKCKGLPIAVNALGEALKGKQEHAWTTALDKLEKYMLTKIEGIDPSVLASLRVSYDMLPSADAKSCFLLCCLFAEDAEIPIDELMRHCVARNLLDQNPRTLDKARDVVRTVVDTLKSASLLTTGGHETVVQIHDVIRDVGISIAREEEAFLVDHGALRWPRNPTNGPSYKAMSLSFKNIKGLPDGLVYQQLETLMVDNSKLSDLDIPDNFFNGMMQLTVLTFTRMHMRRLPSSLAKLTNLRMLYLNRCELEDIAILKDLKSNLEVLSLRGSSIEVLPSEIGQLTSLRLLDLQDCYKLKVIPRGVISNLTGLEELYFPMTFDNWEATTDEQQDTSRRDNASLEELRVSLGNAQLTTLHIHVPNVKLLPKEDLKFADLKGFRISVGSKFDYFEAFISQTCMLKLEGIQLRNEFIPLVDKAEVLILKPKSSVQPLQLFNKLTVLIIEHFKLKYLFSPTTASGLVHLEKLEVTSCEIMEGIVGFEEQKDENEITSEVKFSKLRQLTLTSLPNLISFFAKKEEMGTTMGSFSARAQPLFNEQVIFPVLEWLNIDGLGNIIKIWDKQSIAVLEEQGSFSQLTNLEVEHCSKLMHVFPSNMHPQLKNLEWLEVKECETMKGIVEFEGEIDEDGLRNEVKFSKLKRLELTSLPNLISFFAKKEKMGTTMGSFSARAEPLFNELVIFPVLEELTIDGLGNIIKIWDKQSIAVLEEQGSFSQLTNLEVKHCSKLMHVFPSNMHPLVKNLIKLEVEECETMKGIAEFEGEIDEDGLRNEVASPAREHLEMVGVTEIQDKQPLPEPRKEVESLCRPVNNDDIIVFPQLKDVSLCGLPELKSFYSETQGFFSHKVIFPVLKKLSIRKVRKIIEIWDKQSIAIFEEQGSFCQLTNLAVDKCEKLMHVFPSKMHSPLNNLKLLRVYDCPTMKGIVEFEGEIDEDGLRNEVCFSELSSLELSFLPNLESFFTKLGKAGTTEGNSTIHALPLFNGKVVFPVMKHMDFRKLDKITRIWDDQPLSEPEKEAKSFSKLKDIRVDDCNQLEYILPSYMLPQLKNLQHLSIDSCTKVEVIISNKPKEKEATNNNDIIRFPQLKTLRLGWLPNLKSFICSDETQSIFSNKTTLQVAFLVLEELDFSNLDKITRIWDNQPLSEPEKEAKSFCQLKKILVNGCNQFEYLLPFYMLPQLKKLQELSIRNCTKMEVIISNNPKEKETANNTDTIRFPQLKEVELKNLPNLKSFICSETQLLFSNKDAFPVLEEITLEPQGTLEFLQNETSTKEVSMESSCSNPRPKRTCYRRHLPRPLLQEGEINSVVQLDESGGGVTQFQSVEEGDSATSSTHILPQASGSESAITLPALEEIDLDANLQIFRIGTCPQLPKPECYRRQPQRSKPKHNRRHPPRPLLQEGEINSVIQSDELGVGLVP